MSKQHRWLHEEIERWRAEGLVDAPLAATLAARYPLVEGRAWGQLIFTAFGAGIAGLGVILFFAYNWEALPKLAKLALVYGALILSHGAGIVAGQRGARPLAEGLHVLGSMMFGAGIWLIAQIYHIDEHYPDGILVWSLGVLALAWAMRSMVQGMLALVLAAAWLGLEIFEFERAILWGPALVAAGVLPLAWLIRSRVLLLFGLLALIVSTIFCALSLEMELGVTGGFFMAVLYVLAAPMIERGPFPEAAPVARRLGLVFYLVYLFVFSFADAVDSFADFAVDEPMDIVYAAVPLVLAFLAGLAALAVGLKGADDWQIGHLAGVMTALLLVAVIAFGPPLHLDELVAVAFNLIFLAHAVMFILQGCRDADIRKVSLACVMLVAIVLARYLDLFQSLLARSVAFLALGAALYLIGNLFNRARRQRQAGAA